MENHPGTRVRLQDITVAFPGVTAVDDVSVTVNPGEFFSLLGPSGCGKTTLLRTIAGFYKQKTGAIYFNDSRMDQVPAHKRDTGMVFQHYAIFPHLSVWQNVAYGLKPRRVPREQVAERVKDALRLVDLSGYEDRKPRQLSGGQQQRVAVARAIVVQPRVLLMDEPLANLDAKLRVKLRTELRELQQRLGITTIYVTHDQDEALSLSDRVAVMFNGKIAQASDPEELYSEPMTRQVADFVGDGNYLKGTVRQVSDGSVQVQVSDGGLIHARVTAGPAVTPGTELVVSVRPHRVGIVEAPAGSGTLRRQEDHEGSPDRFEGVVAHRVFLGGIVRYHVVLSGGQALDVDQFPTGKQLMSTGAPVVVEVPGEALQLFSLDGKRLA